jgi:hypothetical protein
MAELPQRRQIAAGAAPHIEDAPAGVGLQVLVHHGQDDGAASTEPPMVLLDAGHLLVQMRFHRAISYLRPP